ncbi:MAG: hypothetical protein AAGC76_09465 [Luteibacter sp.]|uniref:hypothetical protein n=1 Tax=Luteibacter sp. TaxID=1886636 RepID=UPI00280709A8|nr:hypothetical protein [Luteibacter sp.]MDQ7996068.1 hypothetical protein [Luteibacter sp.]
MDEIETTDGAVIETGATDTGTDTTSASDAPVDSDAAALAAFDAGVAELTTAPASDEGSAPVTTAADVAAAAAAAKTDDATAHAPPAAGGAPLAVDHAKKDGDAAKPAEPAKDPAKGEAQPDPETDAAVTELGLKGKAETRFREMASTIKTQAQELEPLRAAAERGEQWEKMVLETRATPEQFGQSLGYLAYINSGDPGKMGQAFDFLLGELQALGKNIGREVPGLVDPVADHQDLAQAVQFGEMTRAAALELAQRRVAEQRMRETQSATEQKSRQQAEHDKGMQDVAALSERLKATDPAFGEKLKVLAPVLDSIRQSVPPSQWVAKIEDVYQRIQVAAPVAAAPPAPAARPPVGSMPLRATGTTTPMQRTLKGANEMDAFEMGLQSIGR